MRRLSLPAQWALALGVAALLVTGLIVVVQSHNSDAPSGPGASAEAPANREAAALVAEDQAPHTVRLRPGAVPAAALAAAVRGDILDQTARQNIYGPLGKTSCTQTGSRGAVEGFSCAVSVNGLPYPFVAVVDPDRRLITYCKRDPPPVPSENVLVSAKCLLPKGAS